VLKKKFLEFSERQDMI